ncbi:unnamed protein product [Rotaria sp. Silwood2]|nr:unnamed protein product [Rotaria sp. Silwood2]CAF2814018.1 unnamed protein product [Rotaria sp. Silwood2]CAF3249123.1 unnamed protein product [Rotaria sp. Silwood2]CAF4108585.1 unnamed protein product [Rotaria sp. Silwood2]CAF4252328.1 unnamed protein product [Rotaria sp. Silwood2]
MDSDFIRGHIKTGISKLKDCLDNAPLYFGPVSAFVNSLVECTIAFKLPNGHFYFAPYAFVRSTDTGFKMENPTIFDLEKDAIIANDCFSFYIVMCKVKNSIFEFKDEQQNEICQIKQLCGTMIKVDDAFLSSLGIHEKKNKMNKNTKHVTPSKLVELLKVHTIHIILRRTHWDPKKNEFVPEPTILFCSNAFTPVNASVRVREYNYSPNKLQITQVSSVQNANQYNLVVSYVISEMYKCTALKKKYLKALIFTDNEQESSIHPNYKFMTDEGSVDSILIPVDQYESS